MLSIIIIVRYLTFFRKIESTTDEENASKTNANISLMNDPSQSTREDKLNESKKQAANDDNADKNNDFCRIPDDSSRKIASNQSCQIEAAGKTKEVEMTPNADASVLKYAGTPQGNHKDIYDFKSSTSGRYSTSPIMDSGPTNLSLTSTTSSCPTTSTETTAMDMSMASKKSSQLTKNIDNFSTCKNLHF